MFFFSPNIDDLLEEAEGLVADDRLEEALALVESACRKAPKNPEGHVRRGSLLMGLGREEEALEAFETALRRDRKHPDALLSLADLLLERSEEDTERVIVLCQQGRRIAARSGDLGLEGEFLLLEGMAHTFLGRPRLALERLDDALERLGADPDVRLEKAIALFECCRFEEARITLEELVESFPDRAHAHHHLGLLAERRGEDESASLHFARARELDPEAFVQPVVLEEGEFDRVVEDALARLPTAVRRYLSNVAIAVEPFPSEDDLGGGELSPTILGVFRGSPLADKASWDPWAHFPSSIVLYQRNLERVARDREELIEEIDVTLLHEVGHFLGWDEEDLRERGLD